jgi:hypothetical protein
MQAAFISISCQVPRVCAPRALHDWEQGALNTIMPMQRKERFDNFAYANLQPTIRNNKLSICEVVSCHGSQLITAS